MLMMVSLPSFQSSSFVALNKTNVTFNKHFSFLFSLLSPLPFINILFNMQAPEIDIFQQSFIMSNKGVEKKNQPENPHQSLLLLSQTSFYIYIRIALPFQFLSHIGRSCATSYLPRLLSSFQNHCPTIQEHHPVLKAMQGERDLQYYYGLSLDGALHSKQRHLGMK